MIKAVDDILKNRDEREIIALTPPDSSKDFEKVTQNSLNVK